MPIRYVPILKGKEGEFGALNELSDEVRRHTMPLIEIPSIPKDWERDRPAKSLEEHVAGVAGKLQDAWANAPLYLDFPWFAQENFGDGLPAMRHVLGGCRDRELNIVPVLRRISSDGHVEAARLHNVTCDSGVCLRLKSGDFSDEIEIEQEVDRLLERLQVVPRDVDVVVDLHRLTNDAETALLIVRSIKSMLPRREEWRRIILAASSFPQDLREVDASSAQKLPRAEWHLWERVRQRPERSLRTDVVFGDYAIAHPEPIEMDPRLMRMSASIRYTTESDWLILKGRNVRQWGFEQFYDLCAELVQQPEYCGADYSWGDRQIALCARRETGTGNATTWRKVATNHHITLVAKQLATRPVP